jgi:hypothetical protein
MASRTAFGLPLNPRVRQLQAKMRPFLIDTWIQTFMIAPFEQGQDLRNVHWGARETAENGLRRAI